MKIIVGLGNPGKEYEKTRHNAGFISVEKIATDNDFENFKSEKKFEAEISFGKIGIEKCIIIKPGTFMNRSGETVKKVLSFYKENEENLLVIHDELDIDIGEFKISSDKNSAGHKGVKSIIENLGTKDFKRIRIGIKKENDKIPTEKYVLEKFTEEEYKKIENVVEKISQKIKEELF